MLLTTSLTCLLYSLNSIEHIPLIQCHAFYWLIPLPVAHPATFFGKIRPIERISFGMLSLILRDVIEILEDKTTLPEMKTFLAPIFDKVGPSGNVPYFRQTNIPKPDSKHIQTRICFYYCISLITYHMDSFLMF